MNYTVRFYGPNPRNNWIQHFTNRRDAAAAMSWRALYGESSGAVLVLNDSTEEIARRRVEAKRIHWWPRKGGAK